MISPQMRKEFVTGYLISEGIVGGLQDIEFLEIEGDVARVLVTNPIKAIVPRRQIVSGCGGTIPFLNDSRTPVISSDLKIDKEMVYDSIKAISASNLHQATGGVHSVGLIHSGEAVCIIEDIGRHNALDKAIGYGVNTKVDFGQTFVASTGRISSDMALKCSMVGIPIIASRSATTSLAATIAKKTRLALIGFVRGKRMNIYTNSWRVTSLENVRKNQQ
jgi:FdhD protein